MGPKERKLRQLIREAIRGMLITERFGSRILTKLHSTTVPKEYAANKHMNKAAFNALSKTYGIKWDKITDKNVKKSNRLTKKGLEIIVAQQDGNIRPTNAWAGAVNIKKGQMLGIALDGKRVWLGGGWNRPDTARTGQGSREGNIGLEARGFNKLDQLMKIGDIKPIILQVDYEAAGDAGEDRASREEARSGALALKKATEVAKENKERYRQYAKAAAGAKGIEPLKKMFDEVTIIYQKAITEASNKLKQGFVNNNWTTNLSTASRAYDDMMRGLKDFIENEAQLNKDKERGRESSGSYSEGARDSAAKDMHRAYKEFKNTMKQLKQQSSDKMWKKIDARY